MIALTDMTSAQERVGELCVHENDILFGRGGKNSKHSGNKRLRAIARTQKNKYSQSTKKEKSELSRSIVDYIRNLRPPGRFLKKDTTTGKWDEVKEEVAREKVSQALRDAEEDSIPLDSNEINQDIACLSSSPSPALDYDCKYGLNNYPVQNIKRRWDEPEIYYVESDHQRKFKSSANLRASYRYSYCSGGYDDRESKRRSTESKILHASPERTQSSMKSLSDVESPSTYLYRRRQQISMRSPEIEPLPLFEKISVSEYGSHQVQEDLYKQEYFGKYGSAYTNQARITSLATCVKENSVFGRCNLVCEQHLSPTSIPSSSKVRFTTSEEQVFSPLARNKQWPTTVHGISRFDRHYNLSNGSSDPLYHDETAVATVTPQTFLSYSDKNDYSSPSQSDF